MLIWLILCYLPCSLGEDKLGTTVKVKPFCPPNWCRCCIDQCQVDYAFIHTNICSGTQNNYSKFKHEHIIVISWVFFGVVADVSHERHSGHLWMGWLVRIIMACYGDFPLYSSCTTLFGLGTTVSFSITIQWIIVLPQHGWGRHSAATWNCHDIILYDIQTHKQWRFLLAAWSVAFLSCTQQEKWASKGRRQWDKTHLKSTGEFG